MSLFDDFVDVTIDVTVDVTDDVTVDVTIDVTVDDVTVDDVTVADFTVVEAIWSEDCVVDVDIFLLCWTNVCEFVSGSDPPSSSEIGRNKLGY